MDIQHIQQQTTIVLLAALSIGIFLGAVMQSSHFCTMGAIADILNFGSWDRARMWCLAIGVAILGTQSLAALGLIDLSKSIYTGGKLLWLAHVIGGTLFGFGMVLAGGCGSKTMLRMGSGSLKGLVVFVFMGLTAYMTLRGVLGVARINFIEVFAIQLPTQDITRLLDTSHWITGGLIGGVLIVASLSRANYKQAGQLAAGICVGLCVVLAWYVSGHMGYIADHPETLQEAFLATNSGRMESLSFVAPSAYWLDYAILFSDKSKVISFGMVSTLGIFIGALVTALATKTFRWEGFSQTRDLAQHLIGAALMGFGGVLAVGCTVGQGLSGVSTLAIGSFLTLLFIIVGAIAALKYQMRVLEASV